MAQDQDTKTAQTAQVKSALYDVTNDMVCDRVIHDVNHRAVMIRRGATVPGVEIINAEAERLIKLRRRLGDGKELQLVKSA